MKTNPTPLTKEQELDKLLGLFLSGNQQYHILTKLLTFDELEYVKKIISGAIIYSQAQAIKQERSRVVKEMKLGMLGIITSVSYSMKLSNGQVTVLNRQINDLLDTLNNSA